MFANRTSAAAGILVYIVLILTGGSFSVAQFRITSPAHTDTIFIGEMMTISWVGGSGAPVTLDYTIDRGLNWQNIASGILGGSYDWPVPYLDSLTIKFRASAGVLTPPYPIWEEPDAHSAEIRSIDVSPDGKYIVTSGRDGAVKLWDVDARSQISAAPLTVGANPYKARFLHGSDSIIIADNETLVIWERSGNTITDITGGEFQNHVRSCAPHPFGSVAAGCSWDGMARVYGTDGAGLLKTCQADIIPDNLYTTRFSKDGSQLVYAGDDGKIYIDRWEESVPTQVIDGHGTAKVVWSVDISPDGNYALSGSIDKTVRLWDLANGLQAHSFEGHESHVRAVRFHPLQNLILSASLDMTLRQWDLTSRAEIEEVRIVSSGQIIDAVYTATGDSIAFTGRDNTIHLYGNFRRAGESDSVELHVRYRARVWIPHLVSSAGEVIAVPVIYDPGVDIPELQGRTIDVEMLIETPNRLLYIFDEVPITRSHTRKDTVSLSLTGIGLADTLFAMNAKVLLGDRFYEEIRLLSFEVTNDSLFMIDRDDGSITVISECEGETQRLVSFSDSDLLLTTSPNPADDMLKVKVGLVEDGRSSIELLDVSGAKVRTLMNETMKNGSYDFQFDISKIPSGWYIVKLATPSRMLTEKILIAH